MEGEAGPGQAGEGESFYTDIIKLDFVCGQNFSFEISHKKKCKNINKNNLICVKHEENFVKRGLNALFFSLRMQIS